MDILSVVAIRLPCSSCGGSYEVPLKDILLSHQLMHAGCSAPVETECPPVFQSRLVSKSSIKALGQAWRRIERQAAADGGELIFCDATGQRSMRTKTAANRSTKPHPGPSSGRAA